MLRRLALCLALPVAVSTTSLPFVSVPAYAATTPVPLVTQIAAEPVSVNAAEFRRHLFVAADVARLSDPAHTSDLLAERVLQHVYALDPSADPAAAATAVQGLVAGAASVTGRAFDSRITRTMVLFQSAAAADRGPLAATLQRATTEVVALTAQEVTRVAADTYAESALGATGDTESRLLASPTFAPASVLRDSAALADGNSRFATARDRVWQSATGVSVSATSAVLLTTAPRLKDNPDVQALAALRDQAGNLTTTGGAIAGTPRDPAPHTIGAAMADLGQALATTQDVAASGAGGSTPVDPASAQESEDAVEDARDAETTLALQTGFLTGGTSAAKDIVEQAGAVATQVTLLAMAFNDFTSADIGRAALSGNALGVVMTLLPLVLEWTGAVGPSAEDLVMAQLDNISAQMAEFQNAVTSQFTLVFEGLSRVSAQLDDISQKLDRAVIDIEQARVQIGQMYDTLNRLQGSLDAVQNNLLEALRNGTNSQLRQTINSALGYSERNGTALPLAAFNDAAAYLHTFATVTARHSPELNTDRPSYDVQNDANQLSTGIASNVHFLDQVPAQRGWTTGRLSGLTGDEPQLANIDDFVLASRAYAQLMLENPRYVSAGYRRWLSDIQQLGAPLASLTSAVSTADTTAGTRSTLLNHLVCARTSAAFAPAGTPCQAPSEDTPPVDALVRQAVQSLSAVVPGYDGPGNRTVTAPLAAQGRPSFDPFVDGSSDVSDLSGLWPTLPGRGQVSQCAAPAGTTQTALGTMERPASLTPSSQGVPQVYQWADRMGLGTLDVCYKTTTRSTRVTACQFGTQWMLVNQIAGTGCSNVFWDPGVGKANVWGVATTVGYEYDDTAFVWTWTPVDAAGVRGAPVYVQSLVRRGAADATAPVGPWTSVPAGAYDDAGAVQTYVNADLVGTNLGTSKTFYELTNVKTVPSYRAPTTAAKVRLEWGDLTRAGASASYQGNRAAIDPGGVLDQPIAGLDPTLSTASAPYARTCTASERATAGLCEVGADGTTRILTQASAARAAQTSIDSHLVTQQADVYRGLLRGTQTAGNTASGPLHDALVRLDGANAMLGSFLQLGASGALRRHDLTALPASLVGSKGLVDALKAELAKTVAGRAGTAPGRLVTDVVDPDALDPLDGLLPLPGSVQRARAAGSPVTVGPVLPALLSTNDQLTLTAIALGAPPSAATTPTTTAPTPTQTPPVVTGPTLPAAPLAFGAGSVPRAKVGRRYEVRIAVGGGTGTVRWTRQGRLPAGLRGRPTASGTAFLVTGRPTRTGRVTFVLTATDAAGVRVSRSFTIRVR
ncbi:hypothetical protein [Nocardioides flavescens]|uniref:Uncharacterized protein n=1 Tax=Nocardioides flavescens TaxID=2691959 RepID=A0A6L7EXI2_9ACTN|nr:hypothetical protein [Nocardioides flavescens]MXG89025.1 hypothetical protein [Nocardioides flavescens]